MNTEAKEEFTRFFVDQTGDKVTVTFTVTGDPDETMKRLSESLYKNRELTEGLMVDSIHFRNSNKENMIQNIVEESLNQIQTKVRAFMQSENLSNSNTAFLEDNGKF